LSYQNAPGTDAVQVRASDGTMWSNWASFTVTGPVPRVIEAFGSTDLDQVGSNYFLYAHATLSGPELKVGGAPVVAGSWVPIGAEVTASGYEIAWKMTGADQYFVWNSDSSGNLTSFATGVVSGGDYALESLEPSFHQDLNRDGQIGPAITVIEA